MVKGPSKNVREPAITATPRRNNLHNSNMLPVTGTHGGNQQQSYQFPANLGKILKIMFYSTTRVSSLAFLIFFLHMMTTVSLLQNIVFMVLAAVLGLHLPTMMAGQLLWVFLTRLLD